MSANKKYEKPFVRDVGGLSVTGQHTMGTCVDGSKPYEQCVTGPSPEGGENPPCNPGQFATYPKCVVGSSASVTCIVGSTAA